MRLELQAEAELLNRMDRVEKGLGKVESEVAELVNAWRTAGGLVKFVKWASAVVAALGVIWHTVKSYLNS